MKRESGTRLLVAEDDAKMGALLSEGLGNAGYEVRLVGSGLEAKRLFAAEPFDASLLDVRLPQKDGFELARVLRRLDPSAPIILLAHPSALSTNRSRFKVNCDDFITTPLRLDELLLRVDTVLARTRRLQPQREADLPFGRFVMDVASRTLNFGHEQIALTEKEFRILHDLVSQKGDVVPRSQILLRVWAKDDIYSSKSLDVYLTRIRKLLRADPAIELVNVHGLGYSLKEHM